MFTKTLFLKIRLLILLVALSSLTACELKPLDIGDVSDVKLKRVEGKTVSVAVKFPVNNPNSLPLTITKADVEVYGGNQKLGKVKIDKKLKLKGKSTTVQEIVFDLDLSDIMGGGLTMIRFLSTGKIELKLKGEVRARSFFLFSSVDVNEKFSISMKDLN